MAGENDAVTLLRYKVDSASVQAAVAANTKVSESYKRLATAGQILQRDMGIGNYQGLQTAGQRLQRDLDARAAREAFITNEMQRQVPLSERLAEAARVRANAGNDEVAALRAASFGSAAGGRTAGQRITGAGRALFNAPDIGGVSTPIARGLIAGGAAVDKLGLSMAQVGALAGVAAVGVVGVALALEEFNKGLEESKKVLTGALSAQDAYYDALAESTSLQVATQLDALKLQRDTLAKQIEETSAALEAAFAQAQRDPLLGDEGARLFFNQLPTGALREQLDELEAEFETTDQTIVRLRQGLDANAFATNDLREEYEKLTESQVEAAKQALAIDDMTREEREERIAAARREWEILEELANASDTTSDAARELATQQDELTREIDALSVAQATYADQLEAERLNKEALSDQTDQIIDLINQEVEARDKLAEINQRIADIEAQRAADIAEVLAESEERLKEIAEDSAEARIAIEEDTADRIAKINRDANRALTTAIGERDAVAFTLAKIRQKDALDDENKSYEKRLKDLDKALIKAELSERKSQDRRLQQINESANRQLTAQYRAAQEQEFIIATSLTSQRFLTEQGMAGMVVATANGFITMQEIVVTSLTNMVGAIRGIFAGGGGGSQFPPLIGGGRGGGAGGGGGALIDRNTANMYQAFRNLKQRTA